MMPLSVTILVLTLITTRYNGNGVVMSWYKDHSNSNKMMRISITNPNCPVDTITRILHAFHTESKQAVLESNKLGTENQSRGIKANRTRSKSHSNSHRIAPELE